MGCYIVLASLSAPVYNPEVLSYTSLWNSLWDSELITNHKRVLPERIDNTNDARAATILRLFHRVDHRRLSTRARVR